MRCFTWRARLFEKDSRPCHLIWRTRPTVAPARTAATTSRSPRRSCSGTQTANSTSRSGVKPAGISAGPIATARAYSMMAGGGVTINLNIEGGLYSDKPAVHPVRRSQLLPEIHSPGDGESSSRAERMSLPASALVLLDDNILWRPITSPEIVVAALRRARSGRRLRYLRALRIFVPHSRKSSRTIFQKRECR